MCNRRPGHFRIRKFRDEQFRAVLHQLCQRKLAAILRPAHLQGKHTVVEKYSIKLFNSIRDEFEQTLFFATLT